MLILTRSGLIQFLQAIKVELDLHEKSEEQDYDR